MFAGIQIYTLHALGLHLGYGLSFVRTLLPYDTTESPVRQRNNYINLNNHISVVSHHTLETFIWWHLLHVRTLYIRLSVRVCTRMCDFLINIFFSFILYLLLLS